MKKDGTISLVLVILLLISCNNGTGKNKGTAAKYSSDQGAAEISFKEYEHDFGKVTEGEKVAYVFSFENKGPGNLVINSAATSCGCTVSKYGNKPIPPGEGGTLEVVFDTSGRNGMQTKTVSVKSNSKTPVVILKITAEVITNNNN
jgi:hypothetical protein